MVAASQSSDNHPRPLSIWRQVVTDDPATGHRSVSNYMRRVVKQPDGCWVTTGLVNHKGYGVAYVLRFPVQAHCLVYWMLRGPYDPALQLDHLCRVRACCNPDHLEPVTALENTRRGERAQQTHCKRGHDLADARVDPRGRRDCRRCAKDRAVLRHRTAA